MSVGFRIVGFILASFLCMGAVGLIGWWKSEPVPLWGYFLAAGLGEITFRLGLRHA